MNLLWTSLWGCIEFCLGLCFSGRSQVWKVVTCIVSVSPDTAAVFCYSNSWLENQILQLETPAAYRVLFMLRLRTQQQTLRIQQLRKSPQPLGSVQVRPVISQSMLMQVAILLHMQNFALCFDKVQNISFGPYLQFIKVSFNAISCF